MTGKRDILDLQIEALYEAAPASLLSIVGAAIALYVYWQPELQTGLLIFFALTGITAILHLASAVVRRRRKGAGLSPRAWSVLARAIYLTSGTCWGAGFAYMLAQGDGQQAIVACCLLMGAVTVSFPAAVYVPAYMLFQVPALTLGALGLAASPLAYGWILAGAAMMLCAVLAMIARGLGAQLALALALSRENRQLVERLEAANLDLLVQSNTDPLTGVANRRGLLAFLARIDGPCALLVVDVDRFKTYNDSFGHEAGDICLKEIAATLASAVDPRRELVARLGGEEFVIVLAGVDRAGAELRAGRMRRIVGELQGVAGSLLRRKVTVSIGLACRGDDHETTMEDLMRQADAAVYAAKRGGRDRVESAPQPDRDVRVA